MPRLFRLLVVAVVVLSGARDTGAVSQRATLTDGKTVVSILHTLDEKIAGDCRADSVCSKRYSADSTKTEAVSSRERLANVIERSGSRAEAILSDLCGRAAAGTLGYVIDQGKFAEPTGTLVALALFWPCNDGKADLAYSAARRVIDLEPPGQLLAVVMRTLHAPHSILGRQLILHEMFNPQLAPWRSIFVAAAVRGDDEVVNAVPWDSVPTNDVFVGVRRRGALERTQVERVVARLLSVGSDHAVVAAAFLYTELPDDSPEKPRIRALAPAILRVAAETSGPIHRELLHVAGSP